MKKLKVYSLIAAGAALLAFATPAFAGTLTVTSGPTFTPDTAFTNNTINVVTLHSPPGVTGDLVKLSGTATITPPASNSATVDIAGSYSANAGDLLSAAYSFTIDSNVSGPVTYTVRGSATILGSPQNFSKTDNVMPGLHQYRGTVQLPIAFPFPASGTFSGTFSLDFGSAALSAAPGTVNLRIQQSDFQLAPTAAILPAHSQALNISTRLAVETGDNVLIGGFIITGTQPKRIIARAIGPSLPLAGALADPVLELRNSSGGLIASNDNWRSDQQAEIIATGVAPTNDLESAIVATLPANNSAYTAIVRGVNNGTGIGLVEAYDLDRSVDSKLANISTRGFAQAGNNVMIGGFILGPTSNDASSIVVRAIGPSLASVGVANPLQDPTLELRNGDGTLIASNDNWMDSSNKQTIIDNGLAPTNDNESALLAIPAPGNYTAIVSGKNNTTGVALVEVYALQ
jgi:hypothetical protein